MSREEFVKKYLEKTKTNLLVVDNLSPKEFSLAMICAALQTISTTLALIADMMEESNGGNDHRT